MIQTERDNEQARQDKIKRERKIEEERQRAIQQRQIDRIEQLAQSLETADTNNILTFVRRKDTNGLDAVLVTFECCGSDQSIGIVEHRVYNGYRSGSRGYKYRLCGAYNNYAERYYTNPKTVIKRVEEFHADEQQKKDVAAFKKSLKERTMAELKSRYPNANVSFEQGYDYGRGRSRKVTADQYRVETDRGYYNFYAYDDGDDIKLTVRNYFFKDVEFAKQIQESVLG